MFDLTTDESTTPVGDSVPKINNELAVGEDLAFQRRWWRFETFVWWFFAILIALDVAGAFGRGFLANARQDVGGLMHVDYERIQRFGTPSVLNIELSPKAVENGAIHLWVSDSLVRKLGNQRIVPQPQSSTIGNGGIAYVFPATSGKLAVSFTLQPTAAGPERLQLQLGDKCRTDLNVFVVP